VRRALIACVALVGAVLAGAPAAAAPPPPRLLVTGWEFDLALSRGTIAPGNAIVQFSNGGEDPHDLRVKRAGAPGNGHGAGKTAPGDLAEFRARLRPGRRYVLWCSLGHHRAKGMVAHLSVHH
jgi:hypothetical protein